MPLELDHKVAVRAGNVTGPLHHRRRSDQDALTGSAPSVVAVLARFQIHDPATRKEEPAHADISTEVRETLIPGRNDRFGPLPPLLVGLTVVTGLVDAFSYLLLGHVFVANMTGNVVFLGFAVAGAPASPSGLHWWPWSRSRRVRSGRPDRPTFRPSPRPSRRRGDRHPGTAADRRHGPGVRRAHAVRFRRALCADHLSRHRDGCAEFERPSLGRARPDHDGAHIDGDRDRCRQRARWGEGSKSGRRLVSVIAMFLGALAGAALILHVHVALPLVIALRPRGGHCGREPRVGPIGSGLDARRRLSRARSQRPEVEPGGGPEHGTVTHGGSVAGAR